MIQEGDQLRGGRITFKELFRRHQVVEIPIIQRDYAHGRESASEVRKEFLNALFSALSKEVGNPTLPLDLDFVYGSIESARREAFLPLDGQQRLTTLFMLHWYLAWTDGRGDDFVAFIKDDQKSRFSYTVRPSSQEFFDSLVGYFPDTTPKDILSLSVTIADQQWFYRSWRLDPTIQSALTMLDAIHERFASTSGFYDRLVHVGRPYITFQLLNLHNFGLSDDLYIKMNARGKPLTPFETFKARLEQHLAMKTSGKMLRLRERNYSMKDYFSLQIDTKWADLFWNYRDEETHLFDERIMHLIRSLAIVTRDPDQPGTEETLEALRDGTVSFSFFKYHEHGCIDTPLIETLIAVLDGWSGGTGGIRTYLHDAAYYNERRVFDSAIKDSTRLTFEELVQFHAYCAYILKHGKDLRSDSFGEWMRVMSNLAVNTRYFRVDDLERSIRSVNEMLNQSDRILAHLSAKDIEVRGFDGQQIREEKFKAQLILKSEEWRSQILRAEQHPYFRGQIEFLFKFSGVLDRWVGNESADWGDEDDVKYRQAFADYFAKASAIFNSDGLTDFGEFRWERALLSIGDYLLPKRSNYSFLINAVSDMASWKRLLRGEMKGDEIVESQRSYMKDLLDQIDLKTGVKESLDFVLLQASPNEDWRRVIAERREMIEFCRQRMIRWQSKNCVYLLRRAQMNGEHAELFSYYLKIGLLSDKYKKGELVPFAEPEYHTVIDLEEPYTYLEYACDDGIIVLRVSNEDIMYSLKMFNRDRELPARLKEELIMQLAFEAEENGSISLSVAREKIESAIDGVVGIVRKFASGPTR